MREWEAADYLCRVLLPPAAGTDSFWPRVRTSSLVHSEMLTVELGAPCISLPSCSTISSSTCAWTCGRRHLVDCACAFTASDRLQEPLPIPSAGASQRQLSRRMELGPSLSARPLSLEMGSYVVCFARYSDFNFLVPQVSSLFARGP